MRYLQKQGKYFASYEKHKTVDFLPAPQNKN